MRMLGMAQPRLLAAMEEYMATQEASVLEKAARLEEAVRRKLQEAQRLDARHAGPASDARLRLGYVADRGNVRFSAALRRGDGVSRKVAVVADIKRRSPHGGPDNGVHEIASYADCGRVVSDVKAWPVDALCVSLDPDMWGGKDQDLVAASRALNNSAPLLAKDLIVHPIQVALAADAGADAVWLSATILGGALPDLLDACTVAGVMDMVLLKSSTDFIKWAEQSKLVISHLCGFITTESACSIPLAMSRISGQISADPAHAASTWENRPSARATGSTSSSLSLIALLVDIITYPSADLCLNLSLIHI